MPFNILIVFILLDLKRIVEHSERLKSSVSLLVRHLIDNADMSNVKRSYNTSRRIRKGF